MSIRLRLILSNIAMTVVPLLSALIAGIVLLIVYTGDVENMELRKNPFAALSEDALKIYEEIDGTIKQSPHKFEDSKYLEGLAKTLRVINTEVAVKKESRVIYSSVDIKDPKVLEFETKVIAHKDQIMGPVSINDHPYAVRQLDFQFDDGTQGNLFLLTDVGPFGAFAKKFFSSWVVTILGIILITNGLLTFWVSRSVLKPLKVLKHGTQQIKEGNLDFKVRPVSSDEIGEVCVAFEEMRQKLKESIELQIQYEEDRKQLISNISHDLKTPITAIKGYIEGIMDGVADTPEKANRYMQTIYAKAKDMDQMIDDLFLFSKLDLNKTPFDLVQVKIKEYFEDCIEELSIDVEKQGMQLRFDTQGPEDAMVLIDREKLKRVIVNIIGNAVKYMGKEQGQIHVKLGCNEKEAVVQVEDTGQGISAEHLPHIFDRFYRADQSRNSSSGGSGLGLAIAKQIIEGHGGSIWAESELGKGTCIAFTLKKVEGGNHNEKSIDY